MRCDEQQQRNTCMGYQFWQYPLQQQSVNSKVENVPGTNTTDTMQCDKLTEQTLLQ